jgi:archaellin
MKKIFLALVLVAASLNIVACTTHAAVDSNSTAMAEERAERAQTAANDSMRK